MNIVTVECPAKINMFLEVRGRMQDGFHEVHTVMHSVSLSDNITCRPREDGIRIFCRDASVPEDENNLVCRAAAALSEYTGYAGGADIHIDKNIPTGSGMGGGSSNAAGGLLALNRLWGLGLSKKEILALSGRLGTDVPFFALLIEDDLSGFSGGAFAGSGRGDEMRKIKGIPGIPVVIAVPPFPLSTKKVYGMLGSEFNFRKKDIKTMIAAMEKGRLREVSECLFNRLEEPVFAENPGIKKIKQDFLSAGADNALMTGSGSAVFCFSPDRGRAERLAGAIREKGKGVRVYVACTS